MTRHPLDVLHKLYRVLKNMLVDPLQDIAPRPTALSESSGVCIVDVPRPVRSSIQKIAVKLEMFDDFSQAELYLIFCHNLSG